MGSSTLSTVLLTAPLAFLAGWLLGKAVFQRMSVLRPNRPSETGVQKASPAHGDLAPDRNEIQLLKEALAERDQVVRDLREKLTARISPLEDTPVNATVHHAKLKETVQALREGLANKDKQLEKMQAEVNTANEKTSQMRQRLQSWRVRIKPLAKQFRQQKMIIGELREELKVREMRQRVLEEKQREKPPTAPALAPATPELQSDEILAVRGIGPVLQKKLAELGIHKLQQLADMDLAKLVAVGKSLSISAARMKKNDWGGQARKLLNLPPAQNAVESTEKEEAAIAG